MMVDYVKETPLAPGFDQILYPGEKEAKSRKERSKKAWRSRTTRGTRRWPW